MAIDAGYVTPFQDRAYEDFVTLRGAVLGRPALADMSFLVCTCRPAWEPH